MTQGVPERGNPTDNPQGAGIPRSVEALALLALKQTLADGYAVYEIEAGTGDRRLKLAAGLSVQEHHAIERTELRHPLGSGSRSGEVVFLCGTGGGDRANLERIARAIDQVWRLSLLAESYAREAACIGALEAELADSKIAERARGLLEYPEIGDDGIDTIVRHAESILRPTSIESTLAQFHQELERQIAERELASRAKAVLRDRYGFSEEQAHAHLRMVSAAPPGSGFGTLLWP